tara:strand:- start:22614 stop:23024 length:411 start_codon:yes stop_codon:yes gene_type:complete
MNKYIGIFLLFSSLSLLGFDISDVQSKSEIYPFDNEEKENLFYSLLNELRCPKCQSSNLAGSNSPISNDLKREVYVLVNKGKSSQEVKSFLVQRYGNFIIYNPPVEPQTYILWYGPFFLVLIAIVGVFLSRKFKIK